MTTSIRAYMFALGIADTLICVCFTIEYTRIGNFGHLVYVYVHNTSLIFSTVLLAFLATDRCLAVSKPHLFSLSTRRAISALVTIAIVSVCYSAIIFLAKMFALGRTHAVLITCMAGVCFLTTVTSYGIMAVLLLMRTKTARRRVGVVPLTQAGSTSLASTSGKMSAGVVTPGSAVSELAALGVPTGKVSAPATRSSPTATQAQRGTLLILVITAVFVVFWVPFFLMMCGLPIPRGATRVFTINSVVNPFIYSFLSPMFRSDVVQFFRETRAKLTSCCRPCLC
ncbi:hypothetical protein NP493_721g01006 [Ridgeia piscesae]|uniref:G-protein coupled receptors family 1 profile domain-containing protein n=1 Tax=Ridgeia piscesae TaxID=27915 RepID=A0AAD9KQA3_RIDPI|nr:hypothetical protein NP493_721g01006 [Ridgeia piscesae]